MKQLIQAAGKWVGICMKDYSDSRAVPDDLVQLCVELSRVTSIHIDGCMEAKVRLKEFPSRYRTWVIDDCPYCHGKHTHGAGEWENDPNRFLTHRTSHCPTPFNNNPGYILTL